MRAERRFLIEGFVLSLQGTDYQLETKLEGIMSHEITHSAQITLDYNGFQRGQQDARTNNIPYRERPNEKLANAGSTLIAVEREMRGHIRSEQPTMRWPLQK